MESFGLWENPLAQPASTAREARQQGGGPPRQRADFHFLYIAPGVSIDYFFDGARQFWETFKVIVIHDLALIQYVPNRYSVAVTSIARSDTAPVVHQQIESTLGDRIYHDPLVYDFLEDLQLTLDVRAERNEPFGVPLDPA
jgi:hypothetical protein